MSSRTVSLCPGKQEEEEETRLVKSLRTERTAQRFFPPPTRFPFAVATESSRNQSRRRSSRAEAPEVSHQGGDRESDDGVELVFLFNIRTVARSGLTVSA